MKDVTAIAVFCEDVRREAGGCETVLGLLQDNIRVQSLPIRFRRLMVYVRIKIAVGAKDLDKPISVTLDGPDRLQALEGFEEAIPKEIIEQGLAKAKAEKLPYCTVLGQIRLQEPVEIKTAGVITANLHVGDQKEVCGLLNISVRGDATVSPQLPSQSPPGAQGSS